MMNLLPLTTAIFSLLAGGSDMGGPTSDTKGAILSRYIGYEVEETQDDYCFTEEEVVEEEVS